MLLTAGLGETGVDPAAAFKALDFSAQEQKLQITLSESFTLSGVAALTSGYTIIGSGIAEPVSVTSVTYLGPILTLNTTPHTPLGDYQLFMPYSGIVSVSTGKHFDGAYLFSYVGSSGTPVAIQLVRIVDARLIEVSFNRNVVEEGALDPANYAFSPSLRIDSIEKVTGRLYRLRTSRQTTGVSYSLTISGLVGT